MPEETRILNLYVNYPESPADAPCFSTVSEALAAMEELAPMPPQTAQALAGDKTFPAPDFDVTPVTLYIGAGVYREKLAVTRPKVTMIGETTPGRETVLVYGQGAFEELENGEKRGTFRTASVQIDAPDFTARNITFQNDAGFGHTVGQALALYVDGDRCYFENCRLIGSQDTLFTAPLPLKEAKPGGFRGPGEHKPRVMGRHLYQNCFIQGDVDFIFGSASAWFEGCEIYSKMPEDREPPQNPDAETVYGYVTAASTFEEVPYGYVFHNCRLTGDCPPRTVYLGRPWREFAKTVFLSCELGAHIHPLGWKDWNKPHGHFFYAEYDSTGPGAAPDQRADFSHQLTEAQAAEYTMDKVLGGWKPCAGQTGKAPASS
ncbi:MAG: pectinesterase family protein [Muribaculum sp.]|nr:pectinesterase family protein [Muribaculum sp.]